VSHDPNCPGIASPYLFPTGNEVSMVVILPGLTASTLSSIGELSTPRERHVKQIKLT